MKQELTAGLILCLISLLLLVLPDTVWRCTEKWKSGGAERPSAAYKAVMRLLSIVLITVGVLLAAGIVK